MKIISGNSAGNADVGGLLIESQEWRTSPPNIVPFFPSWVWDGELATLASWRNGRWEVGAGVVYDTSKITHYKLLVPPEPPNLIQKKLENNEVNYANLQPT